MSCVDKSTSSETVADMGWSGYERDIALLWEELLGRTVADPHANFLALGGNSLLAVQMMLLVREQFGVGITLAAFFAAPTPSALAAAIADAQLAVMSPEELAVLEAEAMAMAEGGKA